MHNIKSMISYFVFLTFLSFSTQAALEKATFGGGCFWCMEKPFEVLDGVKSVEPGYMGGASKNPTYKDVASGKSGHVEVVQIEFDPKKVSFEKLLTVFFQNHNPTDIEGQFVDRGPQYRSIIFYHGDKQLNTIKKFKEALNKAKVFAKPVVTDVEAAKHFTIAEEYHRDYYKKSWLKYKYYRLNSGRDQFLDKVWGKKRDKAFPSIPKN